MSNHACRRRVLMAVWLCAAAATLDGQVPTTFEAASIKRNTSGDGGAGFQIFPGGQFRATNATVRQLVQAAYDFAYERFQIVGGPSWIDVDRFDVQATPGAQADPTRIATPQEIAVRIQALLADRFQLVLRRELRDLLRFDLIVDRPGVLMPTAGQCRVSGVPAASDTRPRCGLTFPPDTGEVQHLVGASATIPALAKRLQQSAEAIVVDKTGLTGTYDFTLDYLRPTLARSQDAAVGVSVFTAVQEQLGLRLERSRGPVEVVVIERVSQPSEN